MLMPVWLIGLALMVFIAERLHIAQLKERDMWYDRMDWRERFVHLCRTRLWFSVLVWVTVLDFFSFVLVLIMYM